MDNGKKRTGTKPRHSAVKHLAFESLETRTLLASDPILDGQPLVISEIVADSTATLSTRTRASSAEPFDGMADSPDWIEILNVSDRKVELEGMHLTDDAFNPTKWRFPGGTSIDAGGFLVVFASGENINDPALDEHGFLHTNFRLSDSGDYLALNNSGGTVVHEFSPMFPAQRTDVSYSVPMTIRELVGPRSTIEYLVPTDDSLEPQWRSPGFNHPSLVRQAAGSPVGFDRGGGSVEPAETIGGELKDRASVDFSRGSIAVLKSLPFTATGRVAEWSFFAKSKLSMTPLLLKAAGGEYEIVGIGRTRVSDGSGTQIFTFDLQSGSDAVEPTGFFFGFKDGDNQVNDQGVVGWTRSDMDTVRRYNGPQSGNVVVGKQLTGGADAGRTYSVQVKTIARLAGPIATNVESAMSNATSLYVRYPFSANQLDTLRSLSLRVRYDDGFVAYLNGTEVARRNASDSVRFNNTATANQPLQNANRFEEINISRFLGNLFAGENVLAIHGLDDSRVGSEFLIDAQLTGVDIRSIAGSGFASEPTPGRPNGIIYRDFVGDTSFSHTRGFYDQPFTLRLDTPATPDATIFYTKDGTDPTSTNPKAIRYQQPIEIDKTTIVRAAGYRDGLLPSIPKTHTFVFPGDVVNQNTLQTVVTKDPVWGPQFTESLKALPTISLVSSDAITVAEEIGTSVELIYPDGSEGFQVDAGVEVFGGTAVSFPKRSFRLSFKNIYGPATLNYDVFNDPSGVTEFDQLLLRPGSHDTPFWTGSAGAGNYIRNRWASDRQFEMGHPTPRSQFVHVYLNGVYWGQFDLMERPNAAFMASTYGGEPADYDALNAGTPIDGDDVAWKALIDSLDDGYDAVRKYLDVVNYADYVLLQFFGGNNIDWGPASNWMAARRREPDAGFQFFTWDSDIILRSGAKTDIVSYAGPGFLWTLNGGLRQYPEFLRLLAERAQLHFFDGGMLTSERLREQIDALADEMRVSVIAETARWGSGRYTPATWESAIKWMKDTYAPVDGPSRASIVIEQMRKAGLFPLSDAPQFSVDGVPVSGDRVTPGAKLNMNAPEGTIYYTLDGSDPRQEAPRVDYTTLVGESAPARVLVPRDNALSSTWLASDFDDSHWLNGTNGIGFDAGEEFSSLIGLNVQEQMKGVNSTAFVRLPFRIDDPSKFDTLQFSLRYDDGFVAYLNGVEIARRNAPESVTWNSRSTIGRANVEAIEFEPFNLSRLRHLLKPGQNVLAIHALNTEPANADLLMTPVLQAGKVTATGVSPTAIRFSEAINMPSDATIKARTLWGDQWSPLTEATSTNQPFPVRVSEVMFHPANPSDLELSAGFSDDSDFEFIELVNISNSAIELTDVELVQATVGDRTEGVKFDFRRSTVRQLGPGERIVVVGNLTAFELRYGDRLPVAGEWTGGLSNNSERITLQVRDEILQEFTYDDDWHTDTDGNGPSLEIIDAANSDLNRWNQSTGWQPSRVVGGTPGRGSDGIVSGDSNRDGVFDSRDIVLTFQAGEFEDNTMHNSTFEEGDWNGDGDFTAADLIFAEQQGNYVTDAPRNARAEVASLNAIYFDACRAVSVSGAGASGPVFRGKRCPAIPDGSRRTAKVDAVAE